jgi:quinol monooxygenase YgiN
MTFSLWEVWEAMAAFDFPSQTSSRTNISKGVNSLVEIVMSRTIIDAASPRYKEYVPIFS